MANYQKYKKRREELKKTRKYLLVKRNYQRLKLLIEDDSGNCTTYYVPVKSMETKRGVAVFGRPIYPKIVRVPTAWEIVGNTANVFAPESLVNKKICLRKGSKSVEGIVLKAVATGKAPGGMPVPAPPPPLDREDTMH